MVIATVRIDGSNLDAIASHGAELDDIGRLGEGQRVRPIRTQRSDQPCDADEEVEQRDAAARTYDGTPATF
ncbi:hypothetical protein [Micromonospora peucetia]|uniref:hypothetical protein n=1 Tax=Micromonospora peucetia TaxID=47871 RepID=UPI00114C9B2C|nr:hypothetical protein [Micromonospora peucetia]